MIVTAKIHGVQHTFRVGHREWRHAEQKWILIASVNDDATGERVYGEGATLEEACDDVVLTAAGKGDAKCKHASVSSASVDHGASGVCITCRMPMRREQKKWIATPIQSVSAPQNKARTSRGAHEP